jgi:hypothetical protein
MADEPQQIRGINWRETFPFTHIFRAFRIAVHPSKLMLGLVALLALYAGGRLLDGIWPARHLAVPGEVYDYERSTAAGATSEQFAHERLRERENLEAAYAQRLLDLKIVGDRDSAAAAARTGKHIGAVKDKILEQRKRRIDEAQQQYNLTLAGTDQIQDPKERENARLAAKEASESNVRTIYHDAYTDLVSAKAIRGMGLFRAFFSYEAERIYGVVGGVISGNWLGNIRDDRGPGVFDSVISFFTVGPVWLMRHHPVYFILFTLLFLTVWAIFGGAIARIAAVHVARDEKLSVRAALAFSMGKFLSFVSAPLIPLLIVLIVGLVPLLAGLLASIPGIGPIFNILMGLAFVLILAAGFVMTLVLLGTFGGFNLMYPTIAVEGSDSFDAISRSFSYVYARPWRMLLYTLVAIVYGALTYLFVKLFIWLMLSLTHHFVGAGMFAQAPSMEPLWSTMWRPPGAPPGRLSYDIDFLTLRGDQDIAAAFVAFWVYLVIGMLGAFAISFYFTANTIIYYLMRHEVDATEMDDVYLEQSEEDFADAMAPPATISASPATAPAAPIAPSIGTTGPEVGKPSDLPPTVDENPQSPPT